jgi:hypothetical protein
MIELELLGLICFGIVVGIEGGLGSGKTVLMVKLLKDDSKDKRVMANFKLMGFKHDDLDVLSLMGDENIKNVSIGIDEMTVFMDCRRSSKKMNMLMSYFILQSRKKGVTLYYTTQDLGMVDIRLYRHTDIQVFCSKLYDSDNVEIEHYRNYIFVDLRNRRNVSTSSWVMFIKPFYRYYDTTEVILPPI